MESALNMLNKLQHEKVERLENERCPICFHITLGIVIWPALFTQALCDMCLPAGLPA